MTLLEYERVIAEIQQLIDDAKALMTEFEPHLMNDIMATEYETLLDLHHRAVKTQRNYTMNMLSLIERNPSLLADR